MEFRISHQARDRYALDERTFSSRAQARLADPALARQLASRIAERGGSRPDRPVNAGDLGAMTVIHEILHRTIERVGGAGGTGFVPGALAQVAADLGPAGMDSTLGAFEGAFPSRPVYAGVTGPSAHLQGETEGVANRELTLEELLLLWIANQNPAFMRYDELFDDRDLAATSGYPRAVSGIRRLSAERAADGAAAGDDIVERLLSPARAAPDSLTGQLRWIRDHWGTDLDRDLFDRLTLSLDVLTEEELGAKRAWERAAGGPRPGAGADSAALHGFGGAAGEAEAFSADRDWMPELVLMAKSTYVWLDQLSRRHRRPIRTLDAIPDEELDTLRDAGFTGLWLIGLWERSHASQRIKQLRGNPEAVASAYSLMDYRIAEDLGGERAWERLRDRAWQRGIRLASDMVPNHMGIDARWVREHPEWFVGRDDPPYPAYTFDGPNLSSDERVGIYLEDHYYDGTDAAVVFKRVDRWSGETRYLYHGNDGTSLPWNDTAQLDYLSAEVREIVIQTILDVARRFPVVRFDAAMVLARKHVQRLWYPLPGEGGAIPSRAESAMSQAEFEARMPHEFWREVVDRVAAETPDTLLLAEAFWLLEGYFVRTLGMHRVYNSAFMHMLREEQNAEYRNVMRETIAFDARILGRYVNFMNNPDERTAVDQFGSGDKYFGVATLLATLPGLPMFGHGQVEGFAEKYGMEFRRARLDEVPDTDLVARHERELFPLLRQRWRFAAADGFRLLDALTGDGSVDEDVYAYANEVRGARSLVVFRNRYADGRVRLAGAGPALGIPDEIDRWIILRDARSGLEFLRNAHDVHAAGLELELHAYACHVFLDPSDVVDGPSRDWARLAWRLGLGGVPDVHRALQDQLLAPVRDAVGGLLHVDLFRQVAGAALGRSVAGGDQLLAQAVAAARGGLGAIAAAAALGGAGAANAEVQLAERSARLVMLVRTGRGKDAVSPEAASVTRWLGGDRARWGMLVGWITSAAIEGVAASDGRSGAGAFEAWEADRALSGALGELGLEDAARWRTVELVRALLAIPADALDAGAAGLDTWFTSAAVRAATGWHEWDGEAYVVREAWEELLDAVAARDAVSGIEDAEAGAARLREAVEATGYRVTSRPEVDLPVAAADSAPDGDAAPDLDATAEPGAEPDADPEAEPGAEPDADPEAEPDPDPDAEPDAEPDPDPDAEPDAEPDPDPDAEPPSEA